MPLITQAKLLETIQVRLEDLSPAFLAYDTDNGKYKLPVQGLYIMLIFEKKNSNIFTTIRRFTPQKYEYFSSKRGEKFKIEIEGSDKVSVNATEFTGGHSNTFIDDNHADALHILDYALKTLGDANV